jgi:hypothetical protein
LEARVDATTAWTHTFPREGRAKARLAFASGVAPRLEVRSAPLGDVLARASFPDPAPRAEMRGDDLAIDYHGFFRFFFLGRYPPGTLELNDAVAWEIDVRGGVAKADFDLRGAALQRIEIGGGVAKVEVRLGAPTGIVPLRVSGGAARVRVTHPRGVAARLRVSGGAAHVELGEQRLGAVGGGLTLASPGWSDAGDGYDVKISGGAARISVEPE